jgi:hypothetical protein
MDHYGMDMMLKAIMGFGQLETAEQQLQFFELNTMIFMDLRFSEAVTETAALSAEITMAEGFA